MVATAAARAEHRRSSVRLPLCPCCQPGPCRHLPPTEVWGGPREETGVPLPPSPRPGTDPAHRKPPRARGSLLNRFLPMPREPRGMGQGPHAPAQGDARSTPWGLGTPRSASLGWLGPPDPCPGAVELLVPPPRGLGTPRSASLGGGVGTPSPNAWGTQKPPALCPRAAGLLVPPPRGLSTPRFPSPGGSGPPGSQARDIPSQCLGSSGHPCPHAQGPQPPSPPVGTSKSPQASPQGSWHHLVPKFRVLRTPSPMPQSCRTHGPHSLGAQDPQVCKPCSQVPHSGGLRAPVPLPGGSGSQSPGLQDPQAGEGGLRPTDPLGGEVPSPHPRRLGEPSQAPPPQPALPATHSGRSCAASGTARPTPPASRSAPGRAP